MSTHSLKGLAHRCLLYQQRCEGRCLAIIGWISVDIVWHNARNQRLLA